MEGSPLDQFFKFKIGDFVTTAAAELSQVKDADDVEDSMMHFRAGEVRYQVIERQLQECSGGVQRKYILRPVMMNGSSDDPVMLHELELAASDRFPARKPSIRRGLRSVSEGLEDLSTKLRPGPSAGE